MGNAAETFTRSVEEYNTNAGLTTAKASVALNNNINYLTTTESEIASKYGIDI